MMGAAIASARVVLVALLMVALGGCSAATPGQPVAEKLPQGVLEAHFSPVLDPLQVFKDGLYEPIPEQGPDQVRIPGYRRRIAADGTTSKVSVLDYNPNEHAWEPFDLPEIVWSPTQRRWVNSSRTETLSAGPRGSRDWPTVKSVSDYGTSYYTISVADLSGQPFSNGLPAGFSEGRDLPDSTRDVKFSPGAKAFQMTTTLIGPVNMLALIDNIDTRSHEFFRVFSCPTPTPNCDIAATSLDDLAKVGGQLQNMSGSVVLDLGTDGRAALRPPGVNIPMANLTYHVVKDDEPQRITLQAAHRDDEDKFTQAFFITLKNFALFEYNGAVTIGNARPSYNTTKEFAGFNRIAVNDVLTHWTPQMPVVLP